MKTPISSSRSSFMAPSRFRKKSLKVSSDARRRAIAATTAVVLLAGVCAAAVRQERGPSPTSAADLRAAIGKLGDLDYGVRSKAGRVIRRAPPAEAVAALLQAAREQEDGYV